MQQRLKFNLIALYCLYILKKVNKFKIGSKKYFLLLMKRLLFKLSIRIKNNEKIFILDKLQCNKREWSYKKQIVRYMLSIILIIQNKIYKSQLQQFIVININLLFLPYKKTLQKKKFKETMWSQYQQSSKLSENKLKRYKSQKLVTSKIKPNQIMLSYPDIKLKPMSSSKLRSKSKLIQSRLFASAKKIDDHLTLITRSTLSDQSMKNSNIISGLTKSASKKSLLSSKKLSITMVISQVFNPQTQQNGNQLSRLIHQNAFRVQKKDDVPFEDQQSSITQRSNIQLALNSQILQMDESTDNQQTRTLRKNQ